MSNSIADVLAEASQILRNAGVPEARREAASLLAYTIAKDRTFLISHSEHELSKNELKSFADSVDREPKVNLCSTSPANRISTGVCFMSHPMF
jgi:methylase of polypeptide subunit release factors